MTNYEWRYNAAGANLGSAWRGSNYSDASWPTGRGVFASEDDNPLVLAQTNTVLPLTTGNGARIETYYFRTYFTFSNDPYQVRVILTNLIDDGAVFYLNGIEFARQNLPAAPTPVTYFTDPSTIVEAAYTTLSIPPDRLIQGENLLSVEVKNSTIATTSGDIVFGLAASAVEPSTPVALVITNQPKDVTVPDSSPVSFSVGVSGFPINFVQWYLNGVVIPGANRLTYTLTNASFPDAGSYTVRLSNSLGGVVSAVAFLSVLGDTNGPQILRAEAAESLTNVVITFNERLVMTIATNKGNYEIVGVGSASAISVSRAVISPNGSNVTLTTLSPLLGNENYILRVSNMRDSSPRTNLSSVLEFPIFRAFSLMDEYSFYHFYNPFVSQDPIGPVDDNPDLGTAWRQPDYVINEQTNHFWGNNALAPGAFFLGSAPLPATKGTELNASLAPVVYFRAPVFAAVTPIGAEVNLEYVMQDGGVVYWNGTEIHRANMAVGEVSWRTRAASMSAVPATWLGPERVSAPFQYGWNTVCAELHSFRVPQTNMAFALRLKIWAGSLAKGPVVFTSQPVNQTVLEGATATFSFMAAGPAYFQWFRNGVAISGATNASYTISPVSIDLDGAEFSVLAWNNESNVMSSNAVLTVQQDFSPLFLHSAYAISRNQILVSFSKPVEPVTATEVQNYQLTNGVGAHMVVISAMVTNGTNVLLEVLPESGNKPPVLVVNNVRDTTFVGHAVYPNSAATIGLNLFFPLDTQWKYEASGSNLGTDWRNVGYNDSAWAEGLALLYNENGVLPGPRNTVLPLVTTNGTKIITYYFRSHFDLPTGATNAIIHFRHVTDDGVILYLNGSEFHRFNLTLGSVQWNTPASAIVGDATFAGPFNGSVANLAGGANVLAAELHAINLSDVDLCFGAEFRITAPSVAYPIPNVPRLAVSRREGYIQLGWTNAGFILQRAATLNGTNTVWEDILDSRSPYTVTGAEEAGFYRLKR